MVGNISYPYNIKLRLSNTTYTDNINSNISIDQPRLLIGKINHITNMQYIEI